MYTWTFRWIGQGKHTMGGGYRFVQLIHNCSKNFNHNFGRPSIIWALAKYYIFAFALSSLKMPLDLFLLEQFHNFLAFNLDNRILSKKMQKFI